jgi:hypothetical protein
MTDQALSGDGQHQHWAASGEQRAANGGSGWQQQGSRVEALPVNRRCCFVGLLGCLPLTDGICDDVLDVVEGIAGDWFSSCVVQYSTVLLQKHFFECLTSLHDILSNCIVP